ncbi:MAG: hypothetical protein ABR591_14780 [Candidatus Velthaea sp.]
MLAPALYFIVILGLVATVSVSGIAAAARSSLATMSERAVDAGVRQLARYQTAIENAVVQDAAYATTLGTVAAPQSIAVLTDPALVGKADYTETVGTLILEEAVTPTTAAAPSCGQGAAGPDTAQRLQCNPWIQESRASLQIDVTVKSADGRATLAQRRFVATARLFAVPPFSLISGMKDSAALEPTDGNVVDETSAPHEDDTGGRNTNTLSPDARYGPLNDGAADTAFHVQYQCRGANCDQPRPPGPDNVADRPWNNGNGPPR